MTDVQITLTAPVAGYEAGTVLTARRTGLPHDYGIHLTYLVPHATWEGMAVALAPMTFTVNHGAAITAD